MSVVLVVEDEESFVEVLQIGLAREGFDVEVARDGAEALVAFDRVQPDLVLLDLMLPKVSGIDVCREIRKKSKTPVIIVSAKSEEVDAVVGLEVGADDYVTKPYGMRELVARMRAVMRRSADGEMADQSIEAPASSRTDGEVVEIGDVRLDYGRHEVEVRGIGVLFPLKEFELLGFLMDHAGKVLPRDTLIYRIWGHDYVGDTKTLDVHIKRIRSKIELDPKAPTRIITIRGLGYKFADTSPNS